MPANSYVSAADCAAMDAETATTARPTPGPWEAVDDDGTGTLPCVLAKQTTSYGNFYVAQCNVFADAQFIAAAPELLHWLKQCEHAFSGRELLGPTLTDGERWLLGNVRTAIQQAEGPNE